MATQASRRLMVGRCILYRCDALLQSATCRYMYYNARTSEKRTVRSRLDSLDTDCTVCTADRTCVESACCLCLMNCFQVLFSISSCYPTTWLSWHIAWRQRSCGTRRVITWSCGSVRGTPTPRQGPAETAHIEATLCSSLSRVDICTAAPLRADWSFDS
jgi:hypothetical protein